MLTLLLQLASMSQEMLKGVDSWYKVFIRLIGKGGMTEELTVFCPKFDIPGKLGCRSLESLTLNHFSVFFCHSF